MNILERPAKLVMKALVGFRSIIPRKRQYGLILFSMLLFGNCSSHKILLLENTKNLIPEGIAVHPTTKELYLSSINEDKVVKINLRGNEINTVLDRQENGYSFGLGLAFHHHHLYALSSLNRSSKSILSIKNLLSNKLETYELITRDSSQFNDLAIDNAGNAYITDSKNHEVFFFDNQTKKIEPYLKTAQFFYPNGIALNEAETKLFVVSFTHGIRIIDLASKKIINPIDERTKQTGIDGLKYHKGMLYFVMNSRVGTEIVRGLYRLKLNKTETGFKEMESLWINKEVSNSPTTLSIVANSIYLLGNSQLENFDEENQIIKDADKLEDIKIIKLKIKNED